MKRPGGFDGGVLEPEPTEEPASASPRTPIRLPEWRLPRRAAPGAAPAETEASAPAVEDAPADELAETVELSPIAPLDGAVVRAERADVPVDGEVAPGDGEAAVVPAVEEPGRPGGRADVDPVRTAEQELKRAQRSVRLREKRERRRFTAHLRRRRRSWLVVGGAVLGLALFVLVGVMTPLMAVREVQVVGASQVDAAALQTALGRFEGRPLALVNDREVHEVLEVFPLIQRYSIERIPPHTLLVRIEERRAVIAVQGDEMLRLLDPAGVLIGETAERPVGVPLAAGSVADPATPGFEAAARVIRDLPADLRERLASVEASSPQDVEFVLNEGTRVVWGEADRTQRKAVVLRAMLASVGAPALVDVSAPDTPVFQ